jgi:hypothetical protein
MRAAMITHHLSEHLRNVNHIFLEQVRTADQKAAYVWSFIIAILLFWSQDVKKGFTWIASWNVFSLQWTLSLLFTASLFFTIVSATLIVLPRVRPSQVSLFWGAWPAAGDRLRNIDAESVTQFVADEYLQNIETLATICRSKFRFVGYAQLGLIATVILHVLNIAAA